MGHRLVRTHYGYRHVLYGHAVRQSHYVAALHSRRILVGKKFLYQRMEATETWHGQYGYVGSQQYRNCLPFQPVQHAVPRVLAGKGYSSARLLRSGECHHRLYPDGTAAGRKGKRKHFLRHQETYGTTTQDGNRH